MAEPIVACARSWIGTRFHHQGRVKKTDIHKGGVDCLGLLVGVARELDLVGNNGVSFADADEIDYSHQPNTKRMYSVLSQLLTLVTIANMRNGDVVLLRIDDSPQHLGIISNFGDGLGLIHAYAPAKAVVEHMLDAWWRERIEAVFRIIN